jgi:hypothetical protein
VAKLFGYSHLRTGSAMICLVGMAGTNGLAAGDVNDRVRPPGLPLSLQMQTSTLYF